MPSFHDYMFFSVVYVFTFLVVQEHLWRKNVLQALLSFLF